MIEGDIFNHDKELPSLDEARTGPKALISKTQAWSVGIFPLGRLEAPLASRLFFLLRHRAARPFAAGAQILPPQGRRSIWREHGVVRVLCAVHKNALPGKIVLLLHKMSGCTMCGDGGYVGRPRAAHTTYN